MESAEARSVAAAGPTVSQVPPTHGALPPRIGAAVSEIAGVVGAWCPTLSPEGDRIAYVTDRSGLPRLEVAHLDPAGDRADAVPRQISPPDQEVVSVAWSPDGQWLAYLVSPGGLIRAELHAVRADGTDHRALAGTDRLSTIFAGCWTATAGVYAFSLADGRGPGADVRLVDVTTGATRIVARGGFLTVTSVSADGSRLIARRGSRGRRHLVIGEIDTAGGGALPVRRLLEQDFPAEGTDLAEDGRFALDGSGVYLRTVAGRDRFALGFVPLTAEGIPGRLRLLADRDDADLESYAILAGGASAMLVWNVDGISRVEIRDLVSGNGYRVDIGDRVMPGWSVHRDGRSAIFELTEPVRPRSIYHVDLADPNIPDRPAPPPHRVAGLPAPDLDAGRLCTPDSVFYPSSDGLVLHGLSYRPARATGPLPTVILLHGGPESQERPAFSILIQSLVAAGMGVFAPNVRGSTGYGLRFQRMDDLDRRESSFQDVPATVEFLVSNGLAAAGRIGVHGWSYGGYLALVAITRWPQLFAAGSSHAGMSDLGTFFTGTEPWMAAASVTEYGDPCHDAALLHRLSPLPLLGRGLPPVLFVHGEQDTNVPVGESVRAHRALTAAGARTEILLLPGEGHTIVGHDGRLRSTAALTRWHLRWTS